jgi:N-methylhydantoinase A/oxoprolinase/acetone carboxylase beta subunit
MLYECVVEIDERADADGRVLTPLNEEAARAALQNAFAVGIRAVAIVFMHGYRFTEHERRTAEIARAIGFTHISTSHGTSPLMKLVSRGDTTVVDAYLSPILRRYVESMAGELGPTRLMFMQSNGGLTDARLFQGKDSILSGPAGGVVGMVAHGAARRLRQSDRLRHGRHLDRRIALRRRVRAGVRDLGGGGAHARRLRASTSSFITNRVLRPDQHAWLTGDAQ